ncbi:MAG TPA: molecular chaperone DnaJ [Candidatus Hydrogenedentes bacterium]|nr:molecular chaperone DnaJ [Candidatus Hydrogenedentota bacterium]
MMARQRDYYEILGVAKNASDEEIRKAYLKLAHKYHPDKTGGDKAAEEKLKEINAAYDTLKNAEKRARYDRFGHAAEQFGAGAEPGFGFEGFDFNMGGGGFDTSVEDLFDALFGGGRSRTGRGRRRAAMPGRDLEYPVRITLREAAFGTKKKIRFNRLEACGDCNGVGAAPGTGPQTCSTCGGAGQVRRSQGFFSVSQTCPECRGAGQVIASPCRSCSGSGRVNGQREISVDIPAGIDAGQRLRLAGEGEPGTGVGPRGDLYIVVQVQPDEVFTREGNDVICEIPVSFPQAALGATIRVPTLRSEAELKIPAGTQTGKTLRLRGMGMPDLRGYGHGDQIVRIQVETPKKLSREQKELLKKFEELSDAQTYPLHRRFVDKIKESLGGK